ncbi:hypothetical protein ACTID9_14940 [Brevibacillus fluminis]|uniref:hypothetical protein n=1 Tax=Brevibacillus fluminis TaxID=511487 RepID=UPI003F89CB10
MRKKTWHVVAVTVSCMMAILILACPTEDDYRKWLADENGIICTGNSLEDTCQQVGKGTPRKITWQSTWEQDTGIYVRRVDRYTDEQGRELVLSSLGIMKHFFAY